VFGSHAIGWPAEELCEGEPSTTERFRKRGLIEHAGICDKEAFMHFRNRWPEAVSIFAVGVAVGAALGVLFAPRSGEETRDFIGDAARTGLDETVAQGRQWARRAQRAASHAGEQIEAATEAGERAYSEAARHV
jgi:hypothetical protein